MNHNKDRFESLSDQSKMIALEAENELFREMLSDVMDGLIKIDHELHVLRQSLYLELDTDETP